MRHGCQRRRTAIFSALPPLRHTYMPGASMAVLTERPSVPATRQPESDTISIPSVAELTVVPSKASAESAGASMSSTPEISAGV